MNKTYPSAVDALRDILKDGQKLAVGGFGLCGIPEALIQAVKDLGAQNLTAIANNAGVDGFGLGLLLNSRQVKKMDSTCSPDPPLWRLPEKLLPRRKAKTTR